MKRALLRTLLYVCTRINKTRIMKRFSDWALLFATLSILSACEVITSGPQDISASIKHFNICLVLDGTDRLSEQNGVPCITNNELLGLAEMLSNKGIGCLYVSYVDKDCDNNQVAIFEWMEDRPQVPGDKPGYMKMKEYNKLKGQYLDDKAAYDLLLSDALREFSQDCSAVSEAAYSDAVAHQKRGSDVNGAINQAGRLLRASKNGADISFIIMVSDGCDNVGKELLQLPQSTELLIVNSNVSKHQYRELISNEFVTLQQAVNYIFK